jgi:hypothetical protein
MTEPTITIVSKTQFENDYQSKLGSLMFPAEWYNCLHHTNTTKLRKNLPTLPKGSKILRVLVPTTNHPDYINKQNKAIPYKHSVCADQTTDGAYHKSYPEMNFAMWVTDHPVGNAIIVVSKTPEENELFEALVADCPKKK